MPPESPAEVLTRHVRARYAGAAGRAGTPANHLISDIAIVSRTHDLDALGLEPLVDQTLSTVLERSYYEAVDLALLLTEYLIAEGYPPQGDLSKSTGPIISWDVQRARNPMPAPIIRLHELLREHILNIFAIREVISQRDTEIGPTT